MRKKSDDLLYYLAKYTLDHQWDVIKHNNLKTTAIMATTATILSIYLGFQIKELNILGVISNLSCIQDIVAAIFFLLTLGCFIFAIVLFIFDLSIFRWTHIDPVETIYHFNKSLYSKARNSITKDIAKIWLKNQYWIAKKNKYRRLSLYSLILGIILIIPSFIIMGFC